MLALSRGQAWGVYQQHAQQGQQLQVPVLWGAGPAGCLAVRLTPISSRTQ